MDVISRGLLVSCILKLKEYLHPNNNPVGKSLAGILDMPCLSEVGLVA